MVAHEIGLSHLASQINRRARRIVSEDSLCRVAALAATAHLLPQEQRLVCLPETFRDLCDREPFLLIVRTRHIFTVPSTSDGTSSAGYSDIPAFGRVL